MFGFGDACPRPLALASQLLARFGSHVRLLCCISRRRSCSGIASPASPVRVCFFIQPKTESPRFFSMLMILLGESDWADRAEELVVERES